MSLQNLGTKWSELEQFTWQQPWDLLVAGNFFMADPQDDRFFPDGSFTDLVLYDRAAGQGEFYLHEPPDPTPIAPFAGYAVPRSAAPGQTVAFHVSSQVGPYSITVYRQETDPVEVDRCPSCRRRRSPIRSAEPRTRPERTGQPTVSSRSPAHGRVVCTSDVSPCPR